MVFWIPVSTKEHRYIAPIGATTTVHMPFFLFGEYVKSYEEEGLVVINPVTLLYGILYGASDDPPGVFTPITPSYFTETLNLLVEALEAPSLETLILRAGANIRDEFGSAMSMRFLENGLLYVPQSWQIRGDLILDIWAAAEKEEDPDYLAAMQRLVDNFRKLDVKNLFYLQRHILSYIAAIAFSEAAPDDLLDIMYNKFIATEEYWTDEQIAKFDEYTESGVFSWKTLSVIKTVDKSKH